ncbi:hypothetical protein [Hoeflea sp.]|uniref:hypothetical protein n=1 Tax=Hoeflea sp. TaxID=1940281 RepID=UPI0019B8691B|nr:hypothetical protein [Hoeflea sp.]MBC7283770.1 hypothetical protein [Hoeflea sp.]
MSDIGIFSTSDLVMLALIACSPGFALGVALGAWISPGHRLRGGLLVGIAGFVLAFAGWWVYLTILK